MHGACVSTLGACLLALCGAVPVTGAAPRVPEALCADVAVTPRADATERAKLTQRAEELARSKDWTGIVNLLQGFLRRDAGDGKTRELCASALEKLGRIDEAAQLFGQATRAYEKEGKDGPARAASASLRRLDPLAQKRDAFLHKLTSELCDRANELSQNAHAERALEILEKLPQVASGKDATRVDTLLGKARAAFEAVKLEPTTSAQPTDGVWPLFEYESAHYRFACFLEPEVVRRLADVMDDIHAYYVQIYFDGEGKRAQGQKAKIRIFPTSAKMLELWTAGSGTTPAGWWSVGSQEVITYDTRSDGGTLDGTLLILFHEASHQFMSLLAGGSQVPSWINEGTASFFEGAVAMADHRVLWPDAASGRLEQLSYQLGNDKGPKPAEVVSYAEPSSYPGDYYPFGWGLVYFLQQYEDPTSFEYVYRPLYAQYRTAIIKRGIEPMKLFEEVFLGPNSPLGHTTFLQFERDWKHWILEEVKPLHGRTPKTRALRLAAVDKYLAAAEAARAEKKPRVQPEDLLKRALAHIEYVRTNIDKEDKPDGALMVRQAELLETLQRPASAAPLYEQALDLADAKRFELDPARYAELEARLSKIDQKNAALRGTRSKMHELGLLAQQLFAEYRAARPPLLLRSYSFASSAGRALDEREVLLPAAAELRKQAQAQGLALGTSTSLRAPESQWEGVFATPATRFEPEADAIVLESVRPQACVNTAIALRGEYELRARIKRKGGMGLACGLLVRGRVGNDWTLVGIDAKGQLALWTVELSGQSGSSMRQLMTFATKPAIAADESVLLSAHVFDDGRLELRAGDRATIETKLAFTPRGVSSTGLFVKDGSATFEEAAVETFP